MGTRIDRITVYTTPDCQQCAMTVKQLCAKGFMLEVVSLEDRPDLIEAFKAKGLMQAPIVEVISYWSGFQPDLINQLNEGIK